MNGVELSVVIPTCDRNDMLRRSILSLYDQEEAPERFEIVVVDDGKIKTAHQVTDEIKKQKGVENIHCFPGRTQGPACARNDGVRKAAGKIILFIGDDIISHPRLLSEHVRIHRQRNIPNLAILGPAYWPPDGEKSRLLEFLMAGDQFSYAFFDDPDDIPYNYFYTSNISLHRSFMLENGMFDEGFPSPAWEDIDLGFRLKEKGLKFIYHEKAIAYHHHETDLASFCRRRHMIGQTAAIFYKKHPGEGKMLMLDRMPRSTGKLRKSFAELFVKFFISMEKRKGTYLIPGKICYPCLRLVSNYYYFRGLRESLEMKEGDG